MSRWRDFLDWVIDDGKLSLAVSLFIISLATLVAVVVIGMAAAFGTQPRHVKETLDGPVIERLDEGLANDREQIELLRSMDSKLDRALSPD